ncbi:MAG: phosphopantetheine-binding protein, partial [Polyangiaceae bacterium]
AQDGELVVDPALFLALKAAVPALERVELHLKHDTHLNELTRFRYDAVLWKAGEGVEEGLDAPAVAAPEPCTLESLRALLRGEPPALRIAGIASSRVRDEVRTVDLLARGEGGATAGELRSTLASLPGRGIDPSQTLALDPAYEVAVTVSAAGADRFDLVGRHRTKGPRAVTVAPAAEAGAEKRPWSVYANVPARDVARDALAPLLRGHLREKVPEYMIPSAFVVLDALPLTPNGKVDRKALPAPDRARTESIAAYTAPRNDVERTISTIWQDMLSIDRVGVDDSFFDLGANSLMMVQANGRLRAALGKSVSLVDMFRFPTVRALAAHVAGEDTGTPGALRESQDRAQTRRDAMARRLENRRTTSRPKP